MLAVLNQTRFGCGTPSLRETDLPRPDKLNLRSAVLCRLFEVPKNGRNKNYQKKDGRWTKGMTV